jgi:hypothetical protein
MIAGLAAEYAEFMLQADHLELASVEEVGCSYVLGKKPIIDMQPDGRGIVIGMMMICHCHDGGLYVRATIGNGLLQIGRKRRNSAAAREGIAEEGHAVGLRHTHLR